MAVEGMKSEPRSHPFVAYQAFAFSLVQMGRGGMGADEMRRVAMANVRMMRMNCLLS